MMAHETRGAVLANSSVKQHSSQLQKSLASAAKSLASRPQELRGPFNSGPANSPTSASVFTTSKRN